jgi:gas vesicle protein
MKLSKIARSLLKTAVYIMDQTAEQVDRASDRASELADDARNAIYPNEDHTLRNFLSFAAGIGVGVGVGMLLAPTSGTELRSTITDKVQDISNRVKGRSEPYQTGTETR